METARDERGEERKLRGAEVVSSESCDTKFEIERGDSVVELDNFKSVLNTYKSPLQEVRDSL